jgi:general secretion pathway protein J
MSSPRDPSRGFSLVELLVAVAVFAALAAIAYGGLANVARTRAALAERQDRFADVVRAMSDLERDLSQAVSRPVRGNYGEPRPALAGGGDHVELTRLGFANPLAEARSNLERVVYAFADHSLRRGRWSALDRAPRSAPRERELLDRVTSLRLRYFGADGEWREAWPPRALPAQAAPDVALESLLPRAIEVRLVLDDLGELRRVIELPSSMPAAAPDARAPPATDDEAAPGVPPPVALPPPPGSSR